MTSTACEDRRAGGYVGCVENRQVNRPWSHTPFIMYSGLVAPIDIYNKFIACQSISLGYQPVSCTGGGGCVCGM